VLLIGAFAGEGKSVLTRKIGIALRARYPLKWISYIRMETKRDELMYSNTYISNHGILNYLKDILFGLKNEFEKKLFEYKFFKNETILIWDGLDCVSNDLKSVVDMIQVIKNKTNNIQYISSRLTSINDAMIYLNQNFYLNFTPFSEIDCNDYIRQYLKVVLQLKKDKIKTAFKRITKLIKTIKSSSKHSRHYLTNPSILAIIGNLFSRESQSNKINSFYDLYEQFYERKVYKEMSKHDFTNGTIAWYIQSLKNFHQYYAFQSLSLRPLFHEDFDNLDINNERITFENSFEMVNNIGIASISYANQTIFLDRTFVDFFVAQYFIENIYNPSVRKIGVNEASLRLNLLFFIMTNRFEYKFTIDLMFSYIENHMMENELQLPFANAFQSVFKDFLYPSFYYTINMLHVSKNPKLICKLFSYDCQNKTEIDKYVKNKTNQSKIFVFEDMKNIATLFHQKAIILYDFYKTNDDFMLQLIDSSSLKDEMMKLKSFKGFHDFLIKIDISLKEWKNFIKKYFCKILKEDVQSAEEAIQFWNATYSYLNTTHNVHTLFNTKFSNFSSILHCAINKNFDIMQVSLDNIIKRGNKELVFSQDFFYQTPLMSAALMDVKLGQNHQIFDTIFKTSLEMIEKANNQSTDRILQDVEHLLKIEERFHRRTIHIVQNDASLACLRDIYVHKIGTRNLIASFLQTYLIGEQYYNEFLLFSDPVRCARMYGVLSKVFLDQKMKNNMDMQNFFDFEIAGYESFGFENTTLCRNFFRKKFLDNGLVRNKNIKEEEYVYD
jgi:hypothetical protein